MFKVLKKSLTFLIFILLPFLLAEPYFDLCPETVKLIFTQNRLLRKTADEKQLDP